jgi:hypothetical protein
MCLPRPYRPFRVAPQKNASQPNPLWKRGARREAVCGQLGFALAAMVAVSLRIIYFYINGLFGETGCPDLCFLVRMLAQLSLFEKAITYLRTTLQFQITYCALLSVRGPPWRLIAFFRNWYCLCPNGHVNFRPS